MQLFFRVRNIFTGYDKEHRTENEVEVFQEVALLQRSSKHARPQSDLYTHLEKMMRVTENADFFSGLPRQTAQQMVKQNSVTDFKNWLASLRENIKASRKVSG